MAITVTPTPAMIATIKAAFIAVFGGATPPSLETSIGDGMASTVKEAIRLALQEVADEVEPRLDGLEGARAAFFAYQNGAQNVPSASFFGMPFDAELFDDGSDFAPGVVSVLPALATPGRFTSPRNKNYIFTAGVYHSSVASGELIISAFYKNGTDLIRGPRLYAGGTTHTAPHTTPPIPLTAGDYIEHWVYAVNGSTAASGSKFTYFGGFEL